MGNLFDYIIDFWFKFLLLLLNYIKLLIYVYYFILIQAELVDALRKRRPRPDASDEDLGLPRSPTTPQKKHRSTMMNQSEGSLSLLSIISSDMDEDSTFGAGNSSNYSKNSSDMSRNLDDVGKLLGYIFF